jgi:hypothetical protein
MKLSIQPVKCYPAGVVGIKKIRSGDKTNTSVENNPCPDFDE